MNILVIEDEANIVQIIRLYLEQAGYTVISANDGIAGLELHAREQPDLVILDLMLPILDGMEVCRRIRAWAETPLLMLIPTCVLRGISKMWEVRHRTQEVGI